jgi:ABC-type transport system involved in multi-copper enzyme maturation permease subunit
MLNYLKSEFYRILHNKVTYLFIIICSILLVSANVVLAAVKATDEKFPYATTKFSLGLFYSDFMMVLLLCIAVAAIIFGNEHNNHTMKNSISYGISRGKIYCGKLIVELLYAFAAFILITGIYIGSSYLLLENSGSGHLELLFETSFAVLPLLIFAVGATNCFLFLLESTGSSIGAVVGLLMGLPLVCNLLGMKFKLFADFANLLPYNMINAMQFDSDKYQLTLLWTGNAGYRNYWLIGIAELLLISWIGLLGFNKKEIK